MMSIVSLSLMLAYIACSLRSAMAVGWMLGWRLVHGPVHPIRLGILFRHWTETSIALRLAPSLPAPLSRTLCVSHTSTSLSPFLNICNICNRQTDWSPSQKNSLFRLFNRVLFNAVLNWPCIFYYAHLHENENQSVLFDWGTEDIQGQN